MKTFLSKFILPLATFLILVASVWAVGTIAAHIYNDHKSLHQLEQIKHDDDVYCEYTPQDFKSNYQIDLKPNGYLILDQQGDVYYVPFGELEDWFIEDNQ